MGRPDLVMSHQLEIGKLFARTQFKNYVPLYTAEQLHPVEQDESFDRTASHMAGEYVSYKAELTDEEIIACFDESEPVAWVYPEGLKALKAGKPWTAYGTRQEPNNTALYLSSQPDIAPYAWVTFTPYGDEDDVWYENPEGQLLEGWTYKPLYDTTPPQRKPLTDEEIEECFAESCTDFKLLENGKTKGVVNIIDVGRAILRKANEK
jgi:hypothetical protein